MTALRAMIVDDNATDRAYLRAMLGYLTEGKARVDESDTASGALALMQPGRYDLVVADYHLMGKETGADLLSQVKSVDPRCRRVLITGDSRKAVIDEATRDAVAQAVVLKASGPARLREALSPILPHA